MLERKGGGVLGQPYACGWVLDQKLWVVWCNIGYTVRVIILMKLCKNTAKVKRNVAPEWSASLMLTTSPMSASGLEEHSMLSGAQVVHRALSETTPCSRRYCELSKIEPRWFLRLARCLLINSTSHSLQLFAPVTESSKQHTLAHPHPQPACIPHS